MSFWKKSLIGLGLLGAGTGLYVYLNQVSKNKKSKQGKEDLSQNMSKEIVIKILKTMKNEFFTVFSTIAMMYNQFKSKAQGKVSEEELAEFMSQNRNQAPHTLLTYSFIHHSAAPTQRPHWANSLSLIRFSLIGFSLRISGARLDDRSRRLYKNILQLAACPEERRGVRERLATHNRSPPIQAALRLMLFLLNCKKKNNNLAQINEQIQAIEMQIYEKFNITQPEFKYNCEVAYKNDP